ncbi:1169_t:CDS:2, partial [Funneliformis geosporum]
LEIYRKNDEKQQEERRDLQPRSYTIQKYGRLQIARIESVDYTIPSESEPFNQNKNYRCTEKRNQANTQELPNLSDLVEKLKMVAGIRKGRSRDLHILSREICAIMIPVEEFIRRAYEDVDKLMANFDDEIIFSVEN